MINPLSASNVKRITIWKTAMISRSYQQRTEQVLLFDDRCALSASDQSMMLVTAGAAKLVQSVVALSIITSFYTILLLLLLLILLVD